MKVSFCFLKFFFSLVEFIQSTTSLNHSLMSSVIKFTPLSGAKNEGPLCYLLQIDDFHILLDCGWDENFSIAAKHIQELKKYTFLCASH